MTTGSLLYGVALVAVFYFLIIRPGQLRQKETRLTQSRLSEGDRVITVGGLHGTVVRVLEKTVVLRTYDNTELEFERLSIGKITVDIPEFPEETEDGDDSEDDSGDAETSETPETSTPA